MNKKLFFYFTFILACVFTGTTYAQLEKGKFINASAGLGMCAPDDETDAIGEGFYAQGEYVWNISSWFGVRPYVGVVVASGESDKNDTQQWNIKSNAALMGAKVRIAAPIPYVAPFVETGLGMSVGSFVTQTPLTDKKKNGAVFHIPVTLGLAIGKKHKYEVKFTYYFHDTVKQFSGAAAFGIAFPLTKE